MRQDVKDMSPQAAALYRAKESNQALGSEERPEDGLDTDAIEKTKARIKKRWAAAQAAASTRSRKKNA